jgi:hypothetical protein
MKEPIRSADVTVRHKINGLSVVQIYCVGNNPTKILANKTFNSRIFSEYYRSKRSSITNTDIESLTILKIKLNAITGYTRDNANWGTTD